MERNINDLINEGIITDLNTMSLNLEERSLTSLKGIEQFTNLSYLYLKIMI